MSTNTDRLYKILGIAISAMLLFVILNLFHKVYTEEVRYTKSNRKVYLFLKDNKNLYYDESYSNDYANVVISEEMKSCLSKWPLYKKEMVNIDSIKRNISEVKSLCVSYQLKMSLKHNTSKFDMLKKIYDTNKISYRDITDKDIERIKSIAIGKDV